MWRKYGDNLWNILVVPSSCALVLDEKVSLECLIFLTCISYAFQPSFVQSFGHPYVYDISVHSLSHMLEQLCCKAFVINFGRLHFLNVSP